MAEQSPKSNGDGAFEVEQSDGSQVEVHLDRTLDVVGQAAGDDGPIDAESPNED